MRKSACEKREERGRCAAPFVYANGGGRRLLLGEPSANTPYPLARTFAPPPHCRRNMHLHSTTIPQPRAHNPTNPNSTILRVESKNDFDTTIPHSRFPNLDHQTATQPCKDLLCRKPDSRTDPLCFWNIGTNELPSHSRVRCSKPYSCLPVLHSMVAARLEADIAARSLVGEQAPCQSPRMCH